MIEMAPIASAGAMRRSQRYRRDGRGGDAGTGHVVHLSAPRAKVTSVPPRGEFRPQRCADADQLETVRQPREPDVVRGHANGRAAKHALAFLDRLPPLLDWSEIPSAARDDRRPTTFPRKASKARRLPTGKCSTRSLAPSAPLQNRQVEYMP